MDSVNLRRDDKESPFFNIPISFWFSTVTMLMVGYGEITPVSYGGRAVSVIAFMCGPVFLALPIIIVGTQFILAIYAVQKKNRTIDASRDRTVFKLLRLANLVVGMQLFQPSDQLPFLDNQFNSKETI